MSVILEARGLTKRYSKTAPPALEDFTLALEPGQIVGLLGPNGSGKTTLIKLACGLLQPTGGQVLIGGAAPGPATKARVSYLPERNALPEWMRVEELLRFYADFYSDFEMDKARDMVAGLGLAAKDQLKTMSKGTQEKVQLVLAMSRAADLYLLDEPIGGVDPAARDFILETILSNYREQALVVISTHLIADIEKVLDRVVMLQDGRLLLDSGVDELRQNTGKSADGYFREVFRC